MTRLRVERLAVRDFRNLAAVELHPAQGLNVLVGANAQGKTSTLEAIHLASTGRLLRPGRESTAVREGTAEAVVLAMVEPVQTEVKVTIRHGTRKLVQVNGSTLKRASDVLGRLPSVSFSSPDLALVDGEPADRRAFADAELAQLYPAYLRAFSGYRRALDQRNSLLRHAQEHPVGDTEFGVWEQRLAESGEVMRAYRLSWLADLEVHASQVQQRLGDGEQVTLRWQLADEGDLGEGLVQRRRQDIARGSTSLGPHRDDIEVTLDQMPAKTHASQGQRRSVVIALKAAVLETAREVLGTPPVLLLDDVFSDLDSRRRGVLLDLAREQGGQVFITCTDAEQGEKLLEAGARLFRVESGRVSEAMA